MQIPFNLEVLRVKALCCNYALFITTKVKCGVILLSIFIYHCNEYIWKLWVHCCSTFSLRHYFMSSLLLICIDYCLCSVTMHS